MRDDLARLQDMLEAIENVERYASKGRDAFFSDELLQVWIIHHLQIAGEAASRLSHGFRARHPELSWADIISLRNVVVHEYFGIDLSEIWDTVEVDLPEVKRSLSAIVDTMKGE